ncbi:MAG: phage scaffolding protein [Clostridia bacterium]|nr:phage scaffolding protein [Clostridia bacterium]
MKKEKLIELGVSEEIAGKVLELHNGAVKELEGQVTKLKGELKTAQDTAKKFEGIDIETVKKEEYERGKSEVSKEFDAYKQETALGAALAKAGSKNNKAVKALLDMDKVTFKDGKFEGLDEQLENIKKDSDYLFNKEDDGKPTFAGKTGGDNGPAAEGATLRAAMGLKTE